MDQAQHRSWPAKLNSVEKFFINNYSEKIAGIGINLYELIFCSRILKPQKQHVRAGTT
jgi:hypothetical protein